MNKKQLGGLLGYCLLAIMVLVPFHALFTTWIGSNYGNLLMWRAWKEVLLVALVFPSVYLFCGDKKLRETIMARLVNKVILIYAVWLVVVSLISSRDVDALLQGLAIDMRPVLFFVLLQIAVFYKPIAQRTLYKVLVVPFISVVAFGVLQMFILPKDFLTWFGYSKDKTIPPYFTIDEQANAVRYASTLSGPNTLGAYLTVPITVLIASVQKYRKQRPYQVAAYLSLFSAFIVFYGSHSRSAWLALAVSFAAYVFSRVSKKYKAALIASTIASLALFGALVFRYQNRSFVQDVILHNNPNTGGRVDSNTGHITALKNGAKDIQERPLAGCGVGCAGPASVRSSNGTKIAENYYIQIGQEAGVIGLGLFLAIIALVGKELYKNQTKKLAFALFVSLLGLSVANMLLHTWADDTLAYVWWGAAAITLYGLKKPAVAK